MEILWTKAEGGEKGRINKVLRPLSALQVVFLLHTFAACHCLKGWRDQRE